LHPPCVSPCAGRLVLLSERCSVVMIYYGLQIVMAGLLSTLSSPSPLLLFSPPLPLLLPPPPPHPYPPPVDRPPWPSLFDTPPSISPPCLLASSPQPLAIMRGCRLPRGMRRHSTCGCVRLRHFDCVVLSPDGSLASPFCPTVFLLSCREKNRKTSEQHKKNTRPRPPSQYIFFYPLLFL